MELEKYKILLDVIDTQNLSNTAIKTGYSTSGISRIIRGIEKELGTQLMVRTRDGVQPTQACIDLLPYIKEFIQAGENVKAIAHKNDHSIRKIKMGVAHVSIYKWLGEALMHYRSEYSNFFDVELFYGSSSELASMIEQNKLDFAIITKREGNFDWIKLWDDEEVAWVPKNHKLSKLSSIPLYVFSIEQCILPLSNVETDYSRIFKKYGVKPNISIAVKDDYGAYSLVSSGLGISINSRISSILDDDKIVTISLEPKIDLEIGFAMRKDLNENVLKFIHTLIDRCQTFDQYKMKSLG